ncbi:MAG: cobalamin biosynthesis protein [Archaeoglobaceae archaeon]
MRVGHTSTAKIALFCFEKDFEKLLGIFEHLRKRYSVDVVFYKRDVWRSLLDYDCIVSYIASGILIRGICSYLRNKWLDPAVVVLDKPLKNAVAILGGHHGGNEIAHYLAQIGINPVITTAFEFKDGLSVGIGFRKNVKAEEIINAISSALQELGFSVEDISALVTVEGKEGEEIFKVAEVLKKPLFFVRKEELNKMNLRETKAMLIGVKNVAEGCALKFAKKGELLMPKRVFGGVTIAIAR